MNFQIIYEQLMENIRSGRLGIVAEQRRSFRTDDGYSFQYDTQTGNTECVFTIEGDDEQAAEVKAQFGQKQTFTFTVSSKGGVYKERTYTQKQFMMGHYKEYQGFKKALAQYRKNAEHGVKPAGEGDDAGKTPRIKSLDEALKQYNTKDGGIDVSVDDIAFNFRKLDKTGQMNISGLALCTFQLQNQKAVLGQNQLSKYSVVATIKMMDMNSKIVRVQMYDPSKLDEDPLQIYTEQQFRPLYPKYIKALKNAVLEYSKRFFS